MKTVKVEPNQTVFDLAVQHYGTAEAVQKLLDDNPDIANDASALIALGVDTIANPAFRLDVAVQPGFVLKIDESSRLIDSRIIQKITNEITTYETWQEQSQKSKRR